MASEAAMKAAERIAPTFKAFYTQRDVDLMAAEIDTLLAAKDAEIAELRHELARLRDCVGAEDVELIDAVLGER